MKHRTTEKEMYLISLNGYFKITQTTALFLKKNELLRHSLYKVNLQV